MPKLTPLQKAAAIAGSAAAIGGVAAAIGGVIGSTLALYQAFKVTSPTRQQTGTKNVQGEVNASAGAIALGLRSTVDVTAPLVVTPARDAVFNGPVQVGPDEKQVGQPKIQLNCAWSHLPKVAPENKLYELELISGTTPSSFVSFAHQPGEAIDMLSSGAAPPYAYLCRFSNFGASAILNFDAELAVLFKKVIGTRSGDVLGPSHTVTTPPISLGNGEKFDFYVRNYAPFYAEVILPTTARDQAVGNNQGHQFELVPTLPKRFRMPPFVDDFQKSR